MCTVSSCLTRLLLNHRVRSISKRRACLARLVPSTPPSRRPGRISSASGDKNNGLKLDGDLYTHLFYGWGFEFHCFEVRKLSGDGENNVVGIRIFNHFQRGRILEYNFPLGTIFWPIFPVGRGSTGSVRRGCPSVL